MMMAYGCCDMLFSGGVLDGQKYGEGASLSQVTLQCNLTIHQFNQLFCDGKAETGPAIFARDRVIDLPERFENV